MYEYSDFGEVDKDYFEVLAQTTYHIVVKSRCTGHTWDIECKNNPGGRSLVVNHKHKDIHKENILNAIKCQANSAKSESTNTTIKGLIKLARGFRNLDNMIALIYLKCSDIVVPLCNRPQPSAEYLARKRARANELRRMREEQRRREFAA